MLQLVDIAAAQIDDYTAIVGEPVTDQLRELARNLSGARILHINATPYGGGVSEMLRSSIAIQLGLGLDVEWRVISGDATFFEVTKNVHNALQGADYSLSDEEQQTYLLQNSYNASQIETDADFVIVHDPQPAAILYFLGHNEKTWVWRCHIDTSEPNQSVLQFLLPFIQLYDAQVFTMDSFVPPEMRDNTLAIIPPAIDPLSPKNFDLSDQQCREIMRWVGVDPGRPLVTQVSRFDPWKDPLGVIRVFREAREHISGLQLALLGSMALDDPGAWQMLEEIRSEVANDPDISVATNMTGIGNVEVNVFQRSSQAIIQKSIREGFGLIVSEALWKGTPVIAGNTGGIPLQMPSGTGGFLIDPNEDALFSERLVFLLTHPDEAARLGQLGRHHVRDHFLITRLIVDELQLLLELTHGSTHPG